MQDKAKDYKSSDDEATQRRVEAIMGRPPNEPTIPIPSDDDSDDNEEPPEKILIIPTSDKPKNDIPSVPATIIEPKKSDDTEETPEDKATAKAVDDIVADEGDAVLAAEDAEMAKAFEPPKKGFNEKIKRFFKAWWENRYARWGTIIGLVLTIIILAIVPNSRYFFLNMFGVRGSVSLSVLDDSTQLPLKNIQVKIANQTGQTDSEGNLKLNRLKLGKTQLSIEKRAFATKTIPITIGWGSNPMGNITIKAIGAQYIFTVSDFLSKKAIDKAEATSGEANAIADKNGKITLTIDTAEIGDDDLSVTIKATNYRDEKLKLDTNAKTEQKVDMVPLRKQVFISNRSGKYDVYKIDVDGKNEELVLAGTGNERSDMTLVPHPSDETVALVSTRDNLRNKDGYLLSTLSLINLGDNSAKSVAQSERIQIIGWIGDRILYVQIAAGASASNPKRSRLMSYDYKTSDKQEIASANYFNDVILVAGNVYYASSTSYQNETVGLVRSSADGKTKKTIINQEVWNIFRVSYEKLVLLIAQSGYDYKIGDDAPTKLAQLPANPRSRVYVDNVGSKHSLWVDQRDGKGVLLDYDVTNKTEKTLKTTSGLNTPIRWVSANTLVYRVHTNQETADYVLNIDGGEARKIRDVYNSSGIDQWYYY